MGQFSISGTAALVHRPRAGGRQFKCQTGNRYFNSNLTLTLCLCSRRFLATLTYLSCPCHPPFLSTTDADDRAGSAGPGMEAGVGWGGGGGGEWRGRHPRAAARRPQSAGVCLPTNTQRTAGGGHRGWPFPARRPRPLGWSAVLRAPVTAAG